MGTYFAYARVSTPRQGEKGVSLTEQREAIERYARSHGLQISRWFEERESASQQGRPEFAEMLRLLRRGTAQGVIIHKIDRSARNLEDWADVGKLVDAGVEIHFATENLDLRTVAGRLSADIQAVVAAHYSRNLREEVKKGIYGRLKQGFYPFRAPLGYLDQGAAKAKIPDPVSAPLVKEAFGLYASGRFSLPELAREMYARGLRNRTGRPVTVNGIVTVLKNPFYIGLMRIRRTGELYGANHEPLITADVFETVQDLLAGKKVDRVERHLFTFSRVARCASCGYSLIGERRKGHTYYRCHNRPFKNPPICPPTTVREEDLDAAVLAALEVVDLTAEEVEIAEAVLASKRTESESHRAAAIHGLNLQRDAIQKRLGRIADLLIDRAIDNALAAKKQAELLIERSRIEEKLTDAKKGPARAIEEITRTVGLAKNPSMLYKTASPHQKRHLVKTLLSDVAVRRKNIAITLALPFRIIAGREKRTRGGPYRGSCRTWEKLIEALINPNR